MSEQVSRFCIGRGPLVVALVVGSLSVVILCGLAIFAVDLVEAIAPGGRVPWYLQAAADPAGRIAVLALAAAVVLALIAAVRLYPDTLEMDRTGLRFIKGGRQIRALEWASLTEVRQKAKIVTLVGKPKTIGIALKSLPEDGREALARVLASRGAAIRI